MKILITGANGLLGTKLVALLSGQPNVELIATARTRGTLPQGCTFHTLDITDRNQSLNVIANVKPDAIIHTAAMTQVDPCELDPEACYRTNVMGVQNIVDAARICNAHLIHLSTDFIFDGTKALLEETDTPNPLSCYGRSKFEAEQLIMRSDVRWSIVRTVLVYGVIPGTGRSNIVTWVKHNLEEKKSIKVVNDQWRTPTLAEDLAFGCYLVAARRAEGIYHIAGNEYMSVYDIALRTADYFKLDRAYITPVNSNTFVQPGKRPLKTGFNISKASHELGYAPHSFEEGIAMVALQMGNS